MTTEQALRDALREFSDALQDFAVQLLNERPVRLVSERLAKAQEKAEAALALPDVSGELLAALREIAECEGKCLLGPEHDRFPGLQLHEQGSHKAFNECAGIAKAAIAAAEGADERIK